MLATHRNHSSSRRARGWAAGVVAGAAAAAALASPAAAVPTPIWPTSVTALPQNLQSPATTTTAEYLPKMKKRIRSRAGQRSLGRDVSVYVADLETGERVHGRRGRNAQIPASNMKSLTALAVLSARGGDYRMPTRVTLSEDGRTLTIAGGGDPLLDSADLKELAATTAARLRSAQAQARADANPDPVADPDTDAEPGGNTGTAAATGSDGETILPAKRLRLRVDDSLFAWPAAPQGWYSSYYTAYADRPFALTRRWASVSDGALDAATYFRAALRREGLRLRKTVKRADAAATDVAVAQFDDHTIADAVAAMMPPSDNSIAENLIRHVAAARGVATTATGSAAAVSAELKGIGIPMRNVRIVDGSGLSRSNRVTAKAMVAVTRTMMDPARPDLATGVYSMPRSGIDGTLSSRFKTGSTRCARNRIMAKTGTLSTAVTLSGIAAGSDGRPRVFSVLVNYHPSSTTTTRYWVDRIATAVTGCR